MTIVFNKKVSRKYKKIEMRMYADSKFNSLSPLIPSGQALWIYLLTCPFNGNIPGIYMAGKAALAESLKWSVSAFDKAFGEVFAEGLARADWNARVIHIKNSVKHNPPASPNVIIGWKNEWESIPECDLKCEAYDSLKSSCEALGRPFLDAFNKALSKPSLKPSTKEMEILRETSNSNSNSNIKDKKNVTKEISKSNEIDILNHLNRVAGKNHGPTKTHLGFITARLSEGATVEQCKAVIDQQAAAWRSNPEMWVYMRPITLFNATKFHSYLGELGSIAPEQETMIETLIREEMEKQKLHGGVTSA